MAVRDKRGFWMCVIGVPSVLIMVTWYSGFTRNITNMYRGVNLQESDSPNELSVNGYAKVTKVRKYDNFRNDGSLRKGIGMLEIGIESKFFNEDFFRNTDVYKNVTCKSDSSMTDFKTSRLTLFDTNINTSEVVTVLVTTRNGRNQERTSGGDVIVIWAEQVGGDGRVPGRVTDQWNGKYIGSVRIFWSGETLIKAKLLSTLENTCVRYNALKKYGNTVFAMKKGVWIMAHYQNTPISNMGRCGFNNNIYGIKQVCNFTTLNGDQNWYCGAPTMANMSCGDISSFEGRTYNTTEIVPNQNKSELIQIPGHGVLKDIVHVPAIQYERTNTKQTPCSARPKRLSWTNDEPAGYVLNNAWHIPGCVAPVPLTAQSYRQCLANKHVHMMGDSTVRQYMEYLVQTVLSIKIPSTAKNFRRNMHYYKYNTTVDYIRHEMPFHFNYIPASGIASLPSYIDNITDSESDGQHGVLLVGLNTHFQAHPADEFQLRIRYLSLAINRLLKKKPKFTVFIKGPHITILDDIRWFDSRIPLLYRDIIYTEFNELKDQVIYLDTWSICVAHDSESIHPVRSALESHIQQFMSYICDPTRLI